MAETKSGIHTPADAPTKPLGAPVKIYPGSHGLGKGVTPGSVISGPASKGGKR